MSIVLEDLCSTLLAGVILLVMTELNNVFSSSSAGFPPALRSSEAIPSCHCLRAALISSTSTSGRSHVKWRVSGALGSLASGRDFYRNLYASYALTRRTDFCKSPNFFVSGTDVTVLPFEVVSSVRWVLPRFLVKTFDLQFRSIAFCIRRGSSFRSQALPIFIFFSNWGLKKLPLAFPIESSSVPGSRYKKIPPCRKIDQQTHFRIYDISMDNWGILHLSIWGVLSK